MKLKLKLLLIIIMINKDWSDHENFAATLAEANLARKNDFIKKKTDFDDKLKNLNKNVTSNKTKDVLIENGLNELLEKVKAISTKGLTKDLINE